MEFTSGRALVYAFSVIDASVWAGYCEAHEIGAGGYPITFFSLTAAPAASSPCRLGITAAESSWCVSAGAPVRPRDRHFSRRRAACHQQLDLPRHGYRRNASSPSRTQQSTTTAEPRLLFGAFVRCANAENTCRRNEHDQQQRDTSAPSARGHAVGRNSPTRHVHGSCDR